MIQETEKDDIEAYGHSFLKTYTLPLWVHENVTSICLPGYKNERLRLLHKKNCSGELKMHLHSSLEHQNTLRKRTRERKKARKSFLGVSIRGNEASIYSLHGGHFWNKKKLMP